MASDLEETPSIGEVLARRLREVGIATREELLAAGEEQAFRRLKDAFPDACAHTRPALAGAVRGIHHSKRPPALKAEIVKSAR